MNNETKKTLDQVSNNLYEVRKYNAPTYWVTVLSVGLLINLVFPALLTTTGLVILIAGAFCYIFNNILNSYIAMREAERAAEKAKVTAAAKAAAKVVKKP